MIKKVLTFLFTSFDITKSHFSFNFFQIISRTFKSSFLSKIVDFGIKKSISVDFFNREKLDF